MRLHGGHDAPCLRQARQGLRACGHVGRRAGAPNPGFAALRHADAVRDRVHNYCGVGGVEVRERDFGVCGRDVCFVIHLHVDVVREQEAGVLASTEHVESRFEGTLL